MAVEVIVGQKLKIFLKRQRENPLHPLLSMTHAVVAAGHEVVAADRILRFAVDVISIAAGAQ